MFKRLLFKLSQPHPHFEPLIKVVVSSQAIRHNLHAYQKKYRQLNFAPVLKANAYGHGLVQIGKIVDAEDIPFIMVDSYYEAFVLRREGIKKKLLLLGYNTPEQVLSKPLRDVSFGITSLDQLKKFVAVLKRRHNFHLKVDTGMNRQGLLVSEISEAVKLMQSNPFFVLEGLATHFAEADGEKTEFTDAQIVVWNDIVDTFSKQFNSMKFIHAGASAGAGHSQKFKANVNRLGIALYGFNISPHEDLQLRPALEMFTVISGVKKAEPGQKVGYGTTFEVKQLSQLATIPVGYCEGVDRRLSNLGSILVNGIPCPIVGRVSMNITTLDVTAVPKARLDTEVKVISSNPKDQNSIQEMAKLCHTIPYDLLVHIPGYLRRVVV